MVSFHFSLAWAWHVLADCGPARSLPDSIDVSQNSGTVSWLPFRIQLTNVGLSKWEFRKIGVTLASSSWADTSENAALSSSSRFDTST